MYCDWVKHCLLLLFWFKADCMDSCLKKIASFSSPPNNDMLIASDCCFVLVDLTWSTFCVHIFRRQLQTNMAVRLCDVASLLRSGSWAPEPWTGVCGTSYFEITWARRPAFCPCSGHTNDVSSQSYFDNQIKMFHLEFGLFWGLVYGLSSLMFDCIGMV